MQKLPLLIACICLSLIVKGQIKVTLKNNQTVRVSKVEFTKKAVLMNDFDKPESPVFEVPKSNIEEVIFEDGTHLKGQELEEKVSSKDDIARIKINDDNDLPKSGLPERDGRIFIEQVAISKDSTIKKERLFSVAKDWVSRTFKNSKSVIDYEDKEEGKLICKGVTKQSFKALLGGRDEITLNFTLDFTFKNGKYRMQIYNLLPIETNYAFDGSKNNMLGDMKVDIDTFNNEYNAKRETKNRLRKYHGEYILKITSMIKPFSDSAIEYISKNSMISKDKDF